MRRVLVLWAGISHLDLACAIPAVVQSPIVQSYADDRRPRSAAMVNYLGKLPRSFIS